MLRIVVVVVIVMMTATAMTAVAEVSRALSRRIAEKAEMREKLQRAAAKALGTARERLCSVGTDQRGIPPSDEPMLTIEVEYVVQPERNKTIELRGSGKPLVRGAFALLDAPRVISAPLSDRT